MVPHVSKPVSYWAMLALAFSGLLLALLVLSTMAVATQPARPAGEEPVETLTEAENIPSEAENVPETRPLPPPTEQQGTTAAAMTAPPARIDFRRFGVRFSSARQQPQQTNATTGVTVEKVRQPSPASKLGLKPGDTIVSVGGKPVTNASQIGQSLEFALEQGQREDHLNIPMVIRRDGAEQTLTLSNAAITSAGYGPLLTEYGHYVAPQYVTGYRGSAADPHIPGSPGGAYLGVELNAKYPEAAIVSHVVPGTPAAEAGLQEGDRIFAINNRPVSSPNELIYWVSRMQPDDTIEISFTRAHDVEVTLGARRASAARQQSEDGLQLPPAPNQETRE